VAKGTDKEVGDVLFYDMPRPRGRGARKGDIG
jgi:hypothetical protein